MNTFNVQWLTQDQTLFEGDWLRFLFKNVQNHIDVEFDPDKIKTDKNTVLICNHAVPYRYVLDKLRSNGKKYVIVLLSDENLCDPCEWLHDPNCVSLIRNYVNPTQITHPKVKVFGLGYKRKFADICKSLNSERETTWCFAGTAHGERAQMLEIFKDYGTSVVHYCSGFGAADSLKTEEYAQTLKNSVFALCPPGQDSNDTFRVYEALEAGCIPVTLRRSKQFDIHPSYWHGVFRGEFNIPFIYAENWEDAKKQVKDLDEATTKKVRGKCAMFWEKWKNNWVTTIEKEVFRLRNS